MRFLSCCTIGFSGAVAAALAVAAGDARAGLTVDQVRNAVSGPFLARRGTLAAVPVSNTVP